MMKRPNTLRLNDHPSHPQSQGIATFGGYTVSIWAITLICRLDISMGQRFEPEQSHHGGATRLLGKGLAFASDPEVLLQLRETTILFQQPPTLEAQGSRNWRCLSLLHGEGELRARPRGGFHGPWGME